jgi:hypothetical protein
VPTKADIKKHIRAYIEHALRGTRVVPFFCIVFS